MKTRKWQDDSGNDRYSTEIQCNDFTFLSTKRESENNASNNQAVQKPIENQQAASKPVAEENDDLPF